jgi:hypothetical protein
MGKEIVYCGDCGKSLREDDFSKGKAQHLDHRPYCTDCKPLAAAPPQAHTSSKLAAMKISTARHPAVTTPSTRRRQAEGDSSRTALLVGAGLVVAAILILLVFTLSSGSSRPEEPPAPVPVAAPTPKPAPKPAPAPAPAPNVDKASAAMRELEAVVAATAPPIAILQKCDEVRPLAQGTPFEARLKGIEEKAREDRRVQQLDASLEEVKKLRALDPGYERKEEIVRLLNATLSLSGSRRPEVEETLRTYQRDAQAYVPPAPLPAVEPGPAPAPSPVAAPVLPPGLFDTDATGSVNHWLVLGPFKNRNDFQGMYDNDLLRTEEGHVPSPGLEVTTREGTKIRWTPAVVADGKLDCSQVLSAPAGVPMIAFAACWVVAERDLEVKLRMYADLGFMLYLDGKRFRNQPKGHKFGEEQDILRVKLTAGPHLFLFKLASPSGPPYLQLKLTQNGPERMTGVRISTRPPESRKVLYAQSFNDGIDGFSGSQVDDGFGGTKALSVAPSAPRDRVLTSPITAGTTIRFKVKLQTELRSFQVLMWSNKVKANYWYHVRNLPVGTWTTVEFRLAEARAGYGMQGAGAEGDVPGTLGFHAEGANGAEGRALVDDLEITE